MTNDWISLKEYARETVQKHPALRDRILNIMQLAQDEIADGGSIRHECDLARQDIDSLITRQTEIAA